MSCQIGQTESRKAEAWNTITQSESAGGKESLVQML